jgi:hypothetical protein
MKLKQVDPLIVQIGDGPRLAMLPVHLDAGFTQNDDHVAVWQWSEFLKPGGKTFELALAEAERVTAYMQLHETEALSPDGLSAFTIGDANLVECNPAVFLHEEVDADDGALQQVMSANSSPVNTRMNLQLLDKEGDTIASTTALSMDVDYIRYITKNGAIVAKVRALDDQDESLSMARILGSSGRLLRSLESLLSIIERAAPRQTGSMEYQLARALVKSL